MFRTAVGVFLMSFTTSVFSQDFKVVLDPGHGGKDPGAVSGSVQEKQIVLDVALKIGKLLEKEKGVKVIYTRSTDDFVEVRERTKIANREKADIFVSIHVNSARRTTAMGTETFVMGLSHNQANLEVAKRENAVITMEDDFKKNYAGFDPNRPESLIGLTLMQEQFIAQSIHLASKIQEFFTNDADRSDRGVKQGPFWVLHSAAMPSVLVELGFLSNSEERSYLVSEKGKSELAKAITDAIVNYKRQLQHVGN